MTIISQLSYSRSHRRSRLQKMFAIYFKFRGLSAKGFDMLHALALTMSHKWTGLAVGHISEESMKEVLRLMEVYTSLISHDNVQIPFRVFSQRLNNQGEFGDGTAATVYIKRNATLLPETANANLKKTRAEGMKNPLTELDLLLLANESYPHIKGQMKQKVLDILLQSPEFSCKTYSDKDSAILHPPDPGRQLPSGRENITLQYMLGTVNIPELSYEDQARLMDEWFKQLGWDNPGEKMKVAMKKVVAWIGDQLTVDRLRGLFKFRAEDENSFERMDFMILVFGWLHLQMAYANSLHKQYLGTSKGRGLKQAFELLERKGLSCTMTKGPFFHDLNEALHHVAKANILEEWCSFGGVEELDKLQNHTPEQLRELANRIVDEHASGNAMDQMDMLPYKERDEHERQFVMFNRDVLQYIVLGEEISTGKVGIMEDFLPHLVFRFVGSNNNKYANKCLEMLQAIHREWPPEVMYINFKYSELID